MAKCDCLNFCGDDTRIDPYSESCVDYHNRRTAALKWLADHVPCWDPNSTHIMRCDWHPVGYLFFADEITKTQGFAFSLEELDRERVWIGRSAFATTYQPVNEKKHWYALSYRGKCLDSSHQADATTYTGYPDTNLTMDHIMEGKENAGVRGDAVLISVSYLGFMTRKEFVG